MGPCFRAPTRWFASGGSLVSPNARRDGAPWRRDFRRGTRAAGAIQQAHGRSGRHQRTKDRPLLLKRTLESVCRQTFKDLVWVVINNGGAERSGVDAVVAEAKAAGIQAVAIHCAICSR